MAIHFNHAHTCTQSHVDNQRPFVYLEASLVQNSTWRGKSNASLYLSSLITTVNLRQRYIISHRPVLVIPEIRCDVSVFIWNNRFHTIYSDCLSAKSVYQPSCPFVHSFNQSVSQSVSRVINWPIKSVYQSGNTIRDVPMYIVCFFCYYMTSR